MMATLRRSGFATGDISPVYRIDDVSPRSTKARQQLFRAGAELLVGGDLLGVLLRFRLAREVVAGDGGVEPRRRDLAAALGDVLLAPRDLGGLARGRIGRRLDRGDLVPEGDLVRLQAGDGVDENVRGRRPGAHLGVHDAEIEEGL